jgi:hypothetical protein
MEKVAQPDENVIHNLYSYQNTITAIKTRLVGYA